MFDLNPVYCVDVQQRVFLLRSMRKERIIFDIELFMLQNDVPPLNDNNESLLLQ